MVGIYWIYSWMYFLNYCLKLRGMLLIFIVKNCVNFVVYKNEFKRKNWFRLRYNCCEYSLMKENKIKLE